MYIPRSFQEDDPDTLYDIMRENGFALLISTGGEEPIASHLPITLDIAPDGAASLNGHMAKANQHLDILAENSNALAVFSGPHAYVSPSWYAEPASVPTWSYVAVHAYGNVSLIDDPAELADILADMVHQYEDGRKPPWRMEDLTDDYVARRLRGITGFRLKIERLEGKLKLSQNHPAEAERVEAALRVSSSPGDNATADAMRRYGIALNVE